MVTSEIPIKRRQKIKPEVYKKIQYYVYSEEIKGILDELQNCDLNYKSLSQLKTLFAKSSPGYCLKFAKEIWQSDEINNIILSEVLFEVAQIWNREEDTTRQFIKRFSIEDDWQKRDASIRLLKRSLIHNFQKYKDLFIEFIYSDNVHKRRVALTTAERLANYSGNINFINEEFLELLSPYLNEKDAFILSVSTTTFGEFIKNYPDLTINWLKSKLEDKSIDSYIKASVVYVFSNQSAANHFDESIEIFRNILTEENERIRSARSAMIRNLSKYYPEKVTRWLERNMNLPNVLEHWAEIETVDVLLDI